MSEKLFYKLDALGTTARNPVNKANNTNPYKDSILFDKQRGTVWTGGDEYGNNLTYSNFNGKIFNGSVLSDAKIGDRTITHTKSLFDAIEAVQLTYIENQGITLVQGDTYKGIVKFKLTNIFSYPGDHTYDHSEYGLKLEIGSYTVAKIGYLYAKNADSVTLHYPVSRTINDNTDPNFSSNPKMYLSGVIPSSTLSTSRKDEADHWLYTSNGSGGQEFPYIQWDTDTSTYILNASGLRVDHLNVGVNITNNGSSGLTVSVGGSSDNVAIESGTGISIAAATGGDGLKINHSNSVTAGNKAVSVGAKTGIKIPINIPKIYYDAQGHITSSTTTSTLTLQEGTTISLDENTTNTSITINHIDILPDVTNGQGDNYYVDDVQVNKQGHVTQITYTQLIDTTSGNIASSGKYISKIENSSGHIKASYTDLLDNSTTAANNYYVSKLEIASGHIKATYTQLPIFSLTENVVNSSDSSTTTASTAHTYLAVFKNGETTNYLRSYFTNDNYTGVLIEGHTPSGKDPRITIRLNDITVSNPTTGNDKGKIKVSIGNQDSGFVTVSANSSFTYNTATGLYTTIGSIAGTAIECKLTTSGSSTTGKIGLSIGGNAAGATVTVPFATEATNLTNNPSLAAGTSDTKKITVTAGGKTSSEFTVPFATEATNLTNNPSLAAGTSDTNKITVTAGGKTSSEFTVPYATTAGSADSANTAGFATSATNAEKVLINADQYDTLNTTTVINAVVKLASQNDPSLMEPIRAAKIGITPLVFASNEKSSKYTFESDANNSLWSNPLTSQASLTNNGPFILHTDGNKPDILYSHEIGANKIYGQEFTGNAATATSAAGFTGTVSLQNASNQLKVTVGSTTSSGLTIAYATNAGNADTVDGKHVSCVTALPSSPDTNTIYIIT